MITTFREAATIRLHEIVTHRSVWSKILFLDKSQWMDRSELEELQLSKLRRLLLHAYEKVPFYRKRFDRIGFEAARFESLSQVRDLPVLTKEDLRANYDALLARRHSLKHGFVNSTGGSTGGPVRFYVCSNSAAFRTARDIRFRKWYRFCIGQKKALLWGAQRDLTTRAHIEGYIKPRLMNVLELNAWRMTPDLMRRFVEQIREFKPKIIEAYSRALLSLVDFVLDEGMYEELRIPAVITAEMIGRNERSRIESVFEPVTDRYGSREFGAIAQECRFHKGMHYAAESFLLESDSINGIPDSLLITNFDNLAMPLIRYQCGDRAKISGRPCKCGRELPTIVEFEGRTNELVITPEGNIVNGTVFGMQIRFIDSVEEFQVIQDEIGSIIILVRANRSLRSDEKARIVGRLRPFLGNTMRIELQEVDEIQKSPSGKTSIVKSSLTR